MTDSRFRRVSINLNPRRGADLEEAMDLTGETLTVSVNRAIGFYAATLRFQQAGGHVVHVDAQGKAVRLKFM